MADDRQINRRRFFREGLRELLRPLSERLETAANNLGAMQESKRTVPLHQLLRPPGALAEESFVETCSQCTACVRVCPIQCIKIDTSGEKGGGFPYIDPEVTACVLCDGLYCMPACPSGALRVTPLNQIDMGRAQWHREQCVRSGGENCTICIDHCPIGSFAIELKDGDVTVHEKGCVGCGVCQHDCPTNPKAISVIPAAG